MLFARANLLRASMRAASSTARRPAQQLARRTYASGHSHETKKSSDLPWLLGSVGLGGPAAVYLWQQRPQKKSHDHHGDEHHSASDAEKKEAEAPAEEAEPQPDRDAEQKTEQQPEQQPEQKSEGGSGAEEPKGEPPSNVDQPDSRKEPGDSASTSAKQEGVSNSTTDNPFVNEPGKSVKGEGETETAKVKGTVAAERPQA
ncbi:hypothetical protein P170DRAFT_510380 [Aspergillus steynii IBT 23096]|uniref:Uncharacterized protein n=1 Tax=Aspergillus steynii IBT 23096 TaxID=1392250 RepID=A0A2I2G3T8_9EURO|nr:uncharacterized protein P170DRAFT_510380 [Aspergillus steynii IBT 23096]PLB47552.1 hypothetical protein P170DRAFT_510380 [Aspergillus steynii IBT 23096]